MLGVAWPEVKLFTWFTPCCLPDCRGDHTTTLLQKGAVWSSLGADNSFSFGRLVVSALWRCRVEAKATARHTSLCDTMPPAARDSVSAASSSAGAGADVGDAGPAGLLGGEIVIDWVSRVLRYNSAAHTSGEYGSLYITNFRVVFVQAESNEVVTDPVALPRTLLLECSQVKVLTTTLTDSSCEAGGSRLLPPLSQLRQYHALLSPTSVCGVWSKPVPPALLVHCLFISRDIHNALHTFLSNM